MKYANGMTVKLYDRVSLGSDATGMVVCDFDTRQFHSDFPGDEWSQLEEGALIQFKNFGLIHYKEPMEADVVLLARGGNDRQK